MQSNERGHIFFTDQTYLWIASSTYVDGTGHHTFSFQGLGQDTEGRKEWKREGKGREGKGRKKKERKKEKKSKSFCATKGNGRVDNVERNPYLA